MSVVVVLSSSTTNGVVVDVVVVVVVSSNAVQLKTVGSLKVTNNKLQLFRYYSVCDSPIDFFVCIQHRGVLDDNVIHPENLDLVLHHPRLHLEAEQVRAVHVDVNFHLVAHPLPLLCHQPLQICQSEVWGVWITEVGDAPLEVGIEVKEVFELA